MKSRQMLKAIFLAAAGLMFQETAWSQTSKEFKSVSTEQLKKMLDSLNYEYKTVQGRFLLQLSKPGENNVKYDVFVESFDNGQAIVVSANLIALQVPSDNARQSAGLLNRVNDWNTETALSRAMRRQLLNIKRKEVYVPRLEADLDCSLGVTEENVNRLIQRFPAIVKEFELYMK